MKKHFAAVKARLVSQLPVAITVEDTVVPLAADGTFKRAQYVIAFGGGPDALGDDRFTAPQRPDSNAEYTYKMQAVAVTADAARDVAQKVIDALVRFRPVVAGRKCDPIKNTFSGEAKPENTVKPPLFYVDLEFVLTSRRA